MKGDFTRFTHDAAKRYSKVRKQQGRADVEADFNEQVDIQQHLDENTRRDVIGVTGFPKGDGFKVSVLADGAVQIQPGRAYVDGLLCELRGNTPIDYESQPDLPSPPAVNPVDGRRDLVYLDVWERHITAHQDPSIKEVALGGADTATRVQVMCQIRIKADIANTITCASPLEDWAPVQSGGLMSAVLDAPSIPPDLCSPLPSGAFRGLENRLYRVEIHEGGAVGTAKFKWSRDNGAVTFGISEFKQNEAKRVELARLGRDQMLSIKNGDTVEILGDQTELRSLAGTITAVDLVDAPTRTVTFNDDVDVHKTESHPIVRRWDAALQTAEGTATELEDGIHVSFSGSDFQVGDYWAFTARTAEQGGVETFTDASPRGIAHHYAKLAIIEWKLNAGVWEPDVIDCRDLFPPLTNIQAEDVGFQSEVCDFPPEAKTVKDALEILCQQEHECCTLVAKPGPGWEVVFTEIQPNQDATICFRVGDYPVTQGPVVVAGKGHVKLTGAGPGTKILAQNSECAIRFENCAGVTARDLHASAATSGSGEHLNGVLAFQNCRWVLLSALDVECANGPRRRASCISIVNPTGTNADRAQVEVDDCHFRIGNEQVGLLVINAQRASIRNNRMRVLAVPPGYFNVRVQDTHARAALAQTLAYGAVVVDPAAPPIPKKNVAFNVGNKQLRFATRPSFVGPWQNLLAMLPPPNPTEAPAHVRTLSAQLLLKQLPAAPAPLKNWVNTLAAETASAASQGITIAGTAVQEVVITGNTIEGAAQGIHVGVSHADPTQSQPDRASRVTVSGNFVHVHAVVGATRSRHAIFVGNADSIVVRENYARLSRFVGMQEITTIEGSRLFGYFGRYMNVRENHIDQFGVGIVVQLRGSAPGSKPMWQVHDNLTANAMQSVVKNHVWIESVGNVS